MQISAGREAAVGRHRSPSTGRRRPSSGLPTFAEGAVQVRPADECADGGGGQEREVERVPLPGLWIPDSCGLLRVYRQRDDIACRRMLMDVLNEDSYAVEGRFEFRVETGTSLVVILVRTMSAATSSPRRSSIRSSYTKCAEIPAMPAIHSKVRTRPAIDHSPTGVAMTRRSSQGPSGSTCRRLPSTRRCLPRTSVRPRRQRRFLGDLLRSAPVDRSHHNRPAHNKGESAPPGGPAGNDRHGLPLVDDSDVADQASRHTRSVAKTRRTRVHHPPPARPRTSADRRSRPRSVEGFRPMHWPAKTGPRLLYAGRRRRPPRCPQASGLRLPTTRRRAGQDSVGKGETLPVADLLPRDRQVSPNQVERFLFRHPSRARPATMSTDRSPLFCDTALARRIERAEAQLIAGRGAAPLAARTGDGGFVIPIAGGVASFAEDGSPFNKVVGLGFDGVPTRPRSTRSSGRSPPAAPRCRSSSPPRRPRDRRAADRPRLPAGVVRERARPRPRRRVRPGHAADGIEVRPSGDDEFEAWLDVVADAVAHPDTQGVPWHEEFPREVYRAAERDAAAAGVDALRRPARRRHRRRRRLPHRRRASPSSPAPRPPRASPPRRPDRAARRPGSPTPPPPAATSRVITTQPGSKSQQNAQRRGFDLLYTRAILVKQP